MWCTRYKVGPRTGEKVSNPTPSGSMVVYFLKSIQSTGLMILLRQPEVASSSMCYSRFSPRGYGFHLFFTYFMLLTIDTFHSHSRISAYTALSTFHLVKLHSITITIVSHQSLSISSACMQQWDSHRNILAISRLAMLYIPYWERLEYVYTAIADISGGIGRTSVILINFVSAGYSNL